MKKLFKVTGIIMLLAAFSVPAIAADGDPGGPGRGADGGPGNSENAPGHNPGPKEIVPQDPGNDNRGRGNDNRGPGNDGGFGRGGSLDRNEPAPIPDIPSAPSVPNAPDPGPVNNPSIPNVPNMPNLPEPNIPSNPGQPTNMPLDPRIVDRPVVVDPPAPSPTFQPQPGLQFPETATPEFQGAQPVPNPLTHEQNPQRLQKYKDAAVIFNPADQVTDEKKTWGIASPQTKAQTQSSIQFLVVGQVIAVDKYKKSIVIRDRRNKIKTLYADPSSLKNLRKGSIVQATLQGSGRVENIRQLG